VPEIFRRGTVTESKPQSSSTSGWGPMLPLGYFILGIVAIIIAMHVIPYFFEVNILRNEQIRYIKWMPWLAGGFFTAGFFTRGATKRVVLMLCSAVVLAFACPYIFAVIIAFVFVMYHILSAET
jgi:hypothetical protein